MYRLIVHTPTHIYTLFGNSIDINDYPTIPIGSYVYIPAIDDMFFISPTTKSSALDGVFEETSTLQTGILGHIILGG